MYRVVSLLACSFALICGILVSCGQGQKHSPEKALAEKIEFVSREAWVHEKGEGVVRGFIDIPNASITHVLVENGDRLVIRVTVGKERAKALKEGDRVVLFSLEYWQHMGSAPVVFSIH